MNIQPLEFINALKLGKTERELNKTESLYVDPIRFNELVKKYEHTPESATEYLQTDYSNGYTICNNCGSFYQLGKGFSKHLSSGCLHCEGESKHRVYHVNASKPSEGGFQSRYMCVMFDDGMSYCKDKLEVEKFKSEI